MRCASLLSSLRVPLAPADAQLCTQGKEEEKQGLTAEFVTSGGQSGTSLCPHPCCTQPVWLCILADTVQKIML